jgi:murein L,D-transpeptidase YafK
MAAIPRIPEQEEPARITTLKIPPYELPPPEIKDSQLVIKKGWRRMIMFLPQGEVKFYSIDLGKRPFGPKLHAGDERTPEGRYEVTQKKDYGQTRFYRALYLSYPNPEDWERYGKARKEGLVPANQGIGGDIEIHGGGRGKDWTRGCISLSNRDMDEVFNLVSIGTTVIIEP